MGHLLKTESSGAEICSEGRKFSISAQLRLDKEVSIFGAL